MVKNEMILSNSNQLPKFERVKMEQKELIWILSEMIMNIYQMIVMYQRLKIMRIWILFNLMMTEKIKKIYTNGHTIRITIVCSAEDSIGTNNKRLHTNGHFAIEAYVYGDFVEEIFSEIDFLTEVATYTLYNKRDEDLFCIYFIVNNDNIIEIRTTRKGFILFVHRI